MCSFSTHPHTHTDTDAHTHTQCNSQQRHSFYQLYNFAKGPILIKTHTLTHTHTHTQTHTHTHTHTHKHKHTQTHALVNPPFPFIVIASLTYCPDRQASFSFCLSQKNLCTLSARTHAYVHGMDTHAHPYTRTHTHTHTHTDTACC